MNVIKYKGIFFCLMISPEVRYWLVGVRTGSVIFPVCMNELATSKPSVTWILHWFHTVSVYHGSKRTGISHLLPETACIPASMFERYLFEIIMRVHSAELSDTQKRILLQHTVIWYYCNSMLQYKIIYDFLWIPLDYSLVNVNCFGIATLLTNIVILKAFWVPKNSTMFFF